MEYFESLGISMLSKESVASRKKIPILGKPARSRTLDHIPKRCLCLQRLLSCVKMAINHTFESPVMSVALASNNDRLIEQLDVSN